MRVSAQRSSQRSRVRLRFFRALKAQTLERRLLRVADARFHFALAIRIVHAARKRDGAVMFQHVAV